MRSKLRNRFRIGALCLIALLVLIPLLSQPVAARVTFNSGTGTSTNTNTGPCTVVITMAPSRTVGPLSTQPLIVNFNYTFVDSNTGPSGSNHICTLTVTQTTPPGGTVSATTGVTFVPRLTFTSGMLTTSSNFAAPPPNLVFTINVTMTVWDLNGGGGRMATGTAGTTITIT